MHKELRQLFSKAVKSVKPAQLIKSAIRVHSNKLIVRDRSFLLNHNCYLIGFGKAVYEMAVEVERIIGDHLEEGIISIPHGYKSKPLSSRISVIEGGKNNLPDEYSFYAARRIKQLVEKCDENHLLLVLVSGGGSALLPYPLSPVTLEEKIAVIELLTSSGADIVEVNTVRKALSELKGGKLALAASPSVTLLTFILSDIVGDPLDFIASGPTILPYVSPVQDAFSILQKYRLLEKTPKSVKYVLNTEDKYLSIAKEKRCSVHNIIIGNNLKSLKSMKEEINCSNSNVSVVLSNRIVGLVAEVTKIYTEIIEYTCQYLISGNKTNFLEHINKMTSQHTDAYISDIVKNIKDFVEDSQFDFSDQKHVFFISGGEPTVQVKGNGKGGRNQELSLRMAQALQELKSKNEWMSKFNIFFMSGGTDGIDGPTDAAGALVDSNLIEEASEDGLRAESFIQNNDSYSFFSNFKNGNYLIKVGHTGTNVMDVHVIVFSFKK